VSFAAIPFVLLLSECLLLLLFISLSTQSGNFWIHTPPYVLMAWYLVKCTANVTFFSFNIILLTPRLELESRFTSEMKQSPLKWSVNNCVVSVAVS
jgi:hypothetical protein